MERCPSVYDMITEPDPWAWFLLIGGYHSIAGLTITVIVYNFRKRDVASGKSSALVSGFILYPVAVFTIVFTVFMANLFYSIYYNYYNILSSYENGKYSEVEGVVSDYVRGNPMEPQAVDSFMVGTQHLSFAIAAGRRGFYDQGIISNGQYVKVRYLPLSGWEGDAIVRLEVCRNAGAGAPQQSR